MKTKTKQTDNLVSPAELAIRLEDLHPQGDVVGGRSKVTFGIIRNHLNNKR